MITYNNQLCIAYKNRFILIFLLNTHAIYAKKFYRNNFYFEVSEYFW